MKYLRTNTAVIVSVGPFLDKTDGVTLETALTITNEKITLVADTDAGSAPTLVLDNVTGATSATSNDLNYITGQDNAMMQIELAAADTNRLGRMRLTITDAANHLPVIEDYTVLPAAIYDWLIAGTIVPLPANVTQWLGTAAATPTVNGVPEVDITHIFGATTGVNKLAAHLPAILIGLTTSGGTTTAVVANATTGIDGGVPSAVDDFYNGAVLIVTSGALAGQRTSVTDYAGSTQTFTVVALTAALASGVSFILV